MGAIGDDALNRRHAPTMYPLLSIPRPARFLPRSAPDFLSLLFLFAASALALTSVGCRSLDGEGRAKRPPDEGSVAFRTTVQPLFEQRCIWCHGDRNASAGLNLQNRTIALDANQRFIVPGSIEQSRLYRAITLEGAHPKAMPGDGWGITERQKDALGTWIEAGAPWPDGPAGRLRRKPYRVDLDDLL